MNVNSYIYQSPSSQSVQFGRPDPSSSRKDNSSSSSSSGLNANTNETFQKAKALEPSQKSEVKPSVESGSTIDIYA